MGMIEMALVRQKCCWKMEGWFGRAAAVVARIGRCTAVDPDVSDDLGVEMLATTELAKPSKGGGSSLHLVISIVPTQTLAAPSQTVDLTSEATKVLTSQAVDLTTKATKVLTSQAVDLTQSANTNSYIEKVKCVIAELYSEYASTSSSTTCYPVVDKEECNLKCDAASDRSSSKKLKGKFQRYVGLVLLLKTDKKDGLDVFLVQHDNMDFCLSFIRRYGLIFYFAGKMD
ncbi:hypothetical protein HHK36_005045 [Tetracentron sinense]|uniref:Uncharacterized protein n=1 Tax=Tetracentron sinense TaxID=13715 RepID=A0A834ZNM5_TETSI|nr:hypothetical protein HHK36_005045 [Tetracentron sinense]